MLFPLVVFCNIFLVVSCDNDIQSFYNMFLNHIINVKELERTVRDHLPIASEGLDPFWSFADSWTTIPSGILAGNLYNLGHFDECYKIHYDTIYGKYCLGTFKINMETKLYLESVGINATQITQGNSNTHLVPIAFHWATCVPHTVAVEEIPGLVNYTEKSCYSQAKEKPLSKGAITTLVILSIFLMIVVVSTAFDTYLYYNKKTTAHELLISFSFLTNGRKIFRATNHDHLLCLNGIKAISMMWVILGHEYYIVRFAPLYNVLDVDRWQHDVKSMFIEGATVSVDTFFVIGGLATVFTFLKSRKNGVKFNVILFYVHRYLRLTPALGIMVLIYMYLLKYMGTGPVWNTVDLFIVKKCESGWWSTLLYVTNYVQKDICLPQAWYLSVDMQLYILSPLILIPLYRWPKPTLGALAFLSVAGCIIPFSVSFAEKLSPMQVFESADSKFMVDYYNQTYARFGPYVIGMILGYFLYRIKMNDIQIKMSLFTACALWILCLTGLVACVYSGYPLVAAAEDRWGNSMYIAFDRSGWAIALSGVIFLCVSGYGEPINKFLSLRIFQFLSKISYFMYLIHYGIIVVRFSSIKNSYRFSNTDLFHIFWADFMITLCLSVVASLTFESPIIILEKYIFGHGTPKRLKTKDEKKSVV